MVFARIFPGEGTPEPRNERSCAWIKGSFLGTRIKVERKIGFEKNEREVNKPMALLTNPVLVSVVVLCVLCLCKLNVLMSLIIASMVGAVMGGIGLTDAMGILTNGFANNANTALSYVLLGTFATAIASTGLADILSKKLSKIMGGKGKIMLLILAFIACFSQNLIPVHIAFIPILIPPLLSLMNEMKIDRRGAACALAFGVKAPYISIPFGFGAIFMGIISDNMTQNGMPITVGEVAKYNWLLGACMLVGLLLAVFVTYAKPREYKNLSVNTEESDAITSDKLTMAHYVTILAIIVVVVVESRIGLLSLSATIGLLIMFVGGAIKWNKIDDQFAGGVKIMGLIAIIMLVAGGYADVTFSGSRTRSGKSTRNAEIAFINEYGKRSQQARPFVGQAMEQNADAIANAGAEVLLEWTEKEFAK